MPPEADVWEEVKALSSKLDAANLAIALKADKAPTLAAHFVSDPGPVNLFRHVERASECMPGVDFNCAIGMNTLGLSELSTLKLTCTSSHDSTASEAFCVRGISNFDKALSAAGTFNVTELATIECSYASPSGDCNFHGDVDVRRGMNCFSYHNDDVHTYWGFDRRAGTTYPYSAVPGEYDGIQWALYANSAPYTLRHCTRNYDGISDSGSVWVMPFHHALATRESLEPRLAALEAKTSEISTLAARVRLIGLPLNLIDNGFGIDHTTDANGVKRPTGYSTQIYHLHAECPRGISVKPDVRLEHSFTQGFEGPYLPTAPEQVASNASDATAERPMYYGIYNMGPRSGRGGMSDGWGSVNWLPGDTNGKLFHVTGTKTDCNWHILRFPAKSANYVNTNKYVFRVWIKIVKGAMSIGHESRVPTLYRATTEASPQGWHYIEDVFHTSRITCGAGQCAFNFVLMFFGEGAGNLGEYDVYFAQPHLANAGEYAMSGPDIIRQTGLDSRLMAIEAKTSDMSYTNGKTTFSGDVTFAGAAQMTHGIYSYKFGAVSAHPNDDSAWTHEVTLPWLTGKQQVYEVCVHAASDNGALRTRDDLYGYNTKCWYVSFNWGWPQRVFSTKVSAPLLDHSWNQGGRQPQISNFEAPVVPEAVQVATSGAHVIRVTVEATVFLNITCTLQSEGEIF